MISALRVCERVRLRGNAAWREALADLVVHVLDLPEERVTAVGKDVRGFPERQVAVRLQQFPRRSIAAGGVDPVPGRGREDQAEHPWPRRLPVLDVGVDDGDLREGREVAPGLRGEGGAKLHRGDREPAPREGECRLAGAAADLQDLVRVRRETRQAGQRVVERFRVVGPRLVVPRRDGVEGLPEPFPVVGGAHSTDLTRRPCPPSGAAIERSRRLSNACLPARVSLTARCRGVRLGPGARGRHRAG